MQTSSSMTLSLIQPILYQRPLFDYTNKEEAYVKALAFLDDAESGSEVAFSLSSTGRLFFVGAKSEPSEDELSAIEHALEQPQTPFTYQLEAGRYLFMQLAPPQGIDEIFTISSIAIDGPSKIYLRLLKEGPLAIIAQLWIAR